MAKTGLAVGIDLGTTYSCVGVFQHGKVEIIANDQGNRTTPSYVAFTDSERLIGDAAKNQVAMNPSNTVFGKLSYVIYFIAALILDTLKLYCVFCLSFFLTDAKRLIGRKYTDDTVQSDMKHWSFHVVDDNTKPKIQVEYKGETKTFFPEEVSN